MMEIDGAGVWKRAIALIRRLRPPAGPDGRPRKSDPAPERRDELRRLEFRLAYRFRDLDLLDQALTHASYTNESAAAAEAMCDYESMEFLGDAILGFVVAEFLYLRFKELKEGELTKIRGHLVSARQLQALSDGLELGRYLKLSRGEEKTGGRRKGALLADLFESVVAAIYLDGGLEAARDFVLRQLEDRFNEAARGELRLRDHKSGLQERLHVLGISGPHYRTVEEIGPDHRKEFVVSVSSGGRELSRGRGRSKKEAEQQAAERAIEVLRGLTVEAPVGRQGDDVVQGVGDDGRGETAPPKVENAEGQA